MSKNLENAHFATQTIHSGEIENDQFRATVPPIYQTSTFYFDSAEQGIRRFKGEESCYAYSRGGNPTVNALQEKLTALEGGAGSVACASGMGAIAALIWTFLESGDHIIVGDCIYGCSDVLIRQTLPKFDIKVSAVDTSDIEALKAAIAPNTKMILFETPTNPMMKITDIAAVKKAAGNIMVVVDNTFAPPPIQKPFECGADIVIHSTTKYLNGHGDVIGGVIIAKKQEWVDSLRGLGMSKFTGSVCSPFNAYLTIRGLQTLDLRIERHCQSALKIAQYLQTKPEVKSVFYPGLDNGEHPCGCEYPNNGEHPAQDGKPPAQNNAEHELFKRQMNGLGTGVLSFELQKEVNGKSGFEAAKTLLNNLQIIQIAVSLGDPFSLAEHPFGMTHAVVPEDVKLKAGITPELIRLSVGLEDADDLIADLEQAFSKI